MGKAAVWTDFCCIHPSNYHASLLLRLNRADKHLSGNPFSPSVLKCRGWQPAHPRPSAVISQAKEEHVKVSLAQLSAGAGVDFKLQSESCRLPKRPSLSRFRRNLLHSLRVLVDLPSAQPDIQPGSCIQPISRVACCTLVVRGSQLLLPAAGTSIANANLAGDRNAFLAFRQDIAWWTLLADVGLRLGQCCLMFLGC